MALWQLCRGCGSLPTHHTDSYSKKKVSTGPILVDFMGFCSQDVVSSLELASLLEKNTIEEALGALVLQWFSPSDLICCKVPVVRLILFLEDRHRLAGIQERKKRRDASLLQRSQQTMTAEVLLLVQEPHAWVARAQLGGFYGAFLAQLQGQGELEFLGLGLSYGAKPANLKG